MLFFCLTTFTQFVLLSSFDLSLNTLEIYLIYACVLLHVSSLIFTLNSMRFQAENSLLNGPIVDSSKRGFCNSYHDSLLAQAFCQLKGDFLLWMNNDTNNSALVTFLSLFICEIAIYTSDYSCQLYTFFPPERSRM